MQLTISTGAACLYYSHLQWTELGQRHDKALKDLSAMHTQDYFQNSEIFDLTEENREQRRTMSSLRRDIQKTEATMSLLRLDIQKRETGLQQSQKQLENLKIETSLALEDCRALKTVRNRQGRQIKKLKDSLKRLQTQVVSTYYCRLCIEMACAFAILYRIFKAKFAKAERKIKL